MSRVIVLIATIPARKRSCERLLNELTKQSRKPDGVVLVLDGYDRSPAPKCPFPIILTLRTPKPSGAGQRWWAVSSLPLEDIIINLDDDFKITEAPHLIRNLADTVEKFDCAAAAMGHSPNGKKAPPLDFSRGDLIYAAGCGLAMKVKHLEGHIALSNDIIAKGGPNCLGLGGDDDALISAHCWKSGIRIKHVASGNIYPASGMRDTSQTEAKAKRGEKWDTQKKIIKQKTGWPWPLN